MRLIWLSLVGLACIGTLLLFRSSLRAHAEKYADAIEERVRSNIEAKGDRLDLYRPSLPQPTTTAPSVDPGPLAEPAQAKPELSKPMETVSWHWRQGAKTITKISSNGEKTQLLRDKARQKSRLY
jgi:hypothetical protein